MRRPRRTSATVVENHSPVFSARLTTSSVMPVAALVVFEVDFHGARARVRLAQPYIAAAARGVARFSHRATSAIRKAALTGTAMFQTESRLRMVLSHAQIAKV